MCISNEDGGFVDKAEMNYQAVLCVYTMSTTEEIQPWGTLFLKYIFLRMLALRAVRLSAPSKAPSIT